VRYERLVRDPKAEMQRVLAFLGEPWSPAVRDTPVDPAPSAQRRGNYHKSAFTTSIGRWKTDLSREEIACIQSSAGDTMALLGYALETI
jgi:hypothetical protein